MRTHTCGELRTSDAGTDALLCGWVARDRNHGGVVFLDVRDRTGVVQVVVHPDEQPDAYTVAAKLKTESVVQVRGVVRCRPEGTANPDLATGEIEVAAEEIRVLSEAETPPFPIEDRVEVGEELRLTYRYLDLRRPEMTAVLALRHRINQMMREHMNSLGFLEIETPILTRSTPEGARDFLVPSRLWPGRFYALPQSPQQLKQLLMVAGQDRYYQIVRCLRDEDPRADRALEFTQLDLEMSFVDEEDIFAVIEPLYAGIVGEIKGVEIPTPFPRLPYREAVARYGTDKPDLRYGMELTDLTETFLGTGFRAVAAALQNGGVAKGFAAPGGGALSRRDLDDLVQIARSRGAGGLLWMVVEGEGRIRSPVEKHLREEEVRTVLRATGASPGDAVVVVADAPGRAHSALDGVRRDLASRLDMIPADAWSFCWITNPPLFEWGEEEGKWVSVHHPFTAPASDDLDPETATARAYDLVLNGFEIGGGSIRIHQADLQRRVFETLNLSPEEIETQFGHLLRAFRYGVPPHGGIAMGVDRLVMLLAGKETIRDVTAFPKSQSGQDPLTGAPTPVAPEQLRELGLGPAYREERGSAARGPRRQGSP